ncbi:hypothetical protein ACIBP6_19745 [Nonomuraea terrae]|uniref:hypothetical protein n=1 Tax=Nonomuraea terrae TaxID=2530383 RepID=UPI0037AF70DC
MRVQRYLHWPGNARIRAVAMFGGQSTRLAPDVVVHLGAMSEMLTVGTVVAALYFVISILANRNLTSSDRPARRHSATSGSWRT